jgi:hypothetical protein
VYYVVPGERADYRLLNEPDGAAAAQLEAAEARADVATVKRALSLDEFQVLSDHCADELSLEESARLRGRSRTRQRQLYNAAMARARAALGIITLSA